MFTSLPEASSGCARDDAAVLAPSSGEEPASPRHRAGVASERTAPRRGAQRNGSRSAPIPCKRRGAAPGAASRAQLKNMNTCIAAPSTQINACRWRPALEERSKMARRTTPQRDRRRWHPPHWRERISGMKDRVHLRSPYRTTMLERGRRRRSVEYVKLAATRRTPSRGGTPSCRPAARLEECVS